MVPGDKMAALELNTPPDKVLEAVRKGAHTRMPVYDGTLDNIVGIVNTKDLFYLFSLKGVVVLEDALYPPLFLKPDESLANALRLFKKSRRPMALVRDERGQDPRPDDAGRRAGGDHRRHRGRTRPADAEGEGGTAAEARSCRKRDRLPSPSRRRRPQDRGDEPGRRINGLGIILCWLSCAISWPTPNGPTPSSSTPGVNRPPATTRRCAGAWATSSECSKGSWSVFRGESPGGPPAGPPPSFEDLKTRAETGHADLRDFVADLEPETLVAHGAHPLVPGPALCPHGRRGAGSGRDAHAAPSRPVHDAAEGLRR